ncbi:uncharacterized protein B0H18DRAFT_1009169, partial [Fomitopsis serialis]|uniref:uncharacterized protein n=1 Tax=Fomitopsis serialis TaxID=139415 RepID=UPI002008D037
MASPPWAALSPLNWLRRQADLPNYDIIAWHPGSLLIVHDQWIVCHGRLIMHGLFEVKCS